MISVDMGIEAALNAGFPTPSAAGGAAGSGGAPNSGRTQRAACAAGDRPASFREALRAAKGEDRVEAAVSHPTQGKGATAVQSDPEPAPTPGARGADDPSDETQADEASVTTQVSGCPEPAGIAGTGALQSGPAIEAHASGAAGEIAIPQEGSELLESMSRLQPSAAGGSEARPVSAGPAAQRVDRQPMPPAGETLTDAASQTPVAGEAGTRAESLTAVDAGDRRALAPTDAAADRGGRNPVETVASLPALRPARARLQTEDGPPRSGQPAPAPAASAADRMADGFPPTPGAADATRANSAALRPGPYTESANSNAASESIRPPEAMSTSGGQALDDRQGSSAGSGDFRQTADGLLLAKPPAAGKGPSGEGNVFSEGLAALSRDALRSADTEGTLEMPADSASASRDKETLAGAGRTGVFDQIVQRAAVHVKNDQGEISIDLKPDFLGRVRMQITTENQQVTVRILTELSTVRDMIETGLHQLKSELQGQGLQVGRLEVALADDHRPRDWQQALSAQTWKAPAAGALSAEDAMSTEKRFEPVYRSPRPVGRVAIDMFV